MPKGRTIEDLAAPNWTDFVAQGAVGPGDVQPASHIMAGLLTNITKSLATLPRRAREAAAQFDLTGRYDPGPALESALMTMGGTAFAPRGALGAGPTLFGKPISQEMADFLKKAGYDDRTVSPKVEAAMAATEKPKSAATQAAAIAEFDKRHGAITPEEQQLLDALASPGQSSPWSPYAKAKEQGAVAVNPEELPREVPFGVPEKAQQLGFNVPVVHGTTREPYGNYSYSELLNHSKAGGGLKQDFGQFELPPSEIGVHFGSPRAAAHFTGEYPVEGRYARKFPVVIRAQNPLEMKDIGSWGPRKIADELQRLGFSPKEIRDQVFYKSGGKSDIEKMRDYIQSKGYDSIKYKNTVEDPGHTSYILMDPARARVPWAAFDPAKLADPNLLSGIAGGAVTLDMLRSRNEGGR